jgi:hypothetical protein
MVQRMRSTLRASRFTLAGAVVLSLLLPAAASMAGAAAAGPDPVAHRLEAPGTRAGAIHRLRHVHPRVSEPPAAPAADRATTTPRHTGWDAASLLVHVPAAGITARAEPSAHAREVGTVVGASKYYRVPLVIWVMDVRNGWGRVELPYAWPRTDGWIRLAGLASDRTFVHVDVDLSERTVRVFKHDRLLYAAAGAIGTPSSPTPPGHYVVTDRVPFSGGYLGSFAFGISGTQPHLPAGWSGGNQLAIHGTNDPGSIGTRASAGCVRVSEATLRVLEPLLRLGTPVVIHA